MERRGSKMRNKEEEVTKEDKAREEIQRANYS
jgi:hypothetical protein